MDIHSLIEAIGTSVSKAQQGIERHSLERFFEYFHSPDSLAAASDGEDNLMENEKHDSERDSEQNARQGFEPITARVIMPRADDINRTAPVEVPLVALAHHRQVHLSKVTVRVKTRLTSDGNDIVKADINAPVSNSANAPEQPEAANGSEAGEIELVFNVTDSSEGISRVVQNISKTL